MAVQQLAGDLRVLADQETMEPDLLHFPSIRNYKAPILLTAIADTNVRQTIFSGQPLFDRHSHKHKNRPVKRLHCG